jgi:hypothetical protein
LELRQFPHKTTDFNLSEEQLRAVVEPWVRGQYVDLGERNWNPHEATLTILEGPHLATNELSLGRGWSAALHASEDVTERVLGAAGEVAVATSATPADMLNLLGEDAVVLLQAWRSAAASAVELAPSESLALAEATLRSPNGSAG